VICGMGGSGIAGLMIKKYFAPKAPFPIEVIPDYTIPGYVNAHTLVILCSYSGNTEETLNCARLAKESGAQLLAITTGGALQTWANQHNVPVFGMEKGFQPRVALGSPLSYLFLIINDVLGVQAKADLSSYIKTLESWEDFSNHARGLAEPFFSRLQHKFVIVCDTYFEALGIRLANQIQENAKLEAFVQVLPEANHNAIESYVKTLDSNVIILNSGINKRTNHRFSFFKHELLDKLNITYVQVDVSDTSFKSILHTAYTCDWLSLHLANHLNVVSNQVPIINQLKNYLSTKND
jgi:glucose/mannose-6-phosphate isomerase